MSGPVLVSVERTLTIVTTAHKLATVIGLVSGYALSLRPRMLRWGATDEEVRRPYPGADVVPPAAPLARTISAPNHGASTVMIVPAALLVKLSWCTSGGVPATTM